jgi:hypothetical protein
MSHPVTHHLTYIIAPCCRESNNSISCCREGDNSILIPKRVVSHADYITSSIHAAAALWIKAW